MPVTRGTTNRNERGSAASRRRRKQWLLNVYGNGKIARCSYGCGRKVDFTTITVDRYPIPGCRGGRYVRGNIRPSCGRCNSRDGGRMARRAVA